MRKTHTSCSDLYEKLTLSTQFSKSEFLLVTDTQIYKPVQSQKFSKPQPRGVTRQSKSKRNPSLELLLWMSSLIRLRRMNSAGENRFCGFISLFILCFSSETNSLFSFQVTEGISEWNIKYQRPPRNPCDLLYIINTLWATCFEPKSFKRISLRVQRVPYLPFGLGLFSCNFLQKVGEAQAQACTHANISSMENVLVSLISSYFCFHWQSLLT